MDNETYFRQCWLTLKVVSNARIRKKMDDIECAVGGVRISEKVEQDNAEEPKDKIVPV